MFKLSKESKITFCSLLIIPFLWVAVNHFGLIDSWKTKTVDLRLSSNLPGARGEILHTSKSSGEATFKLEDNKSIPQIPKVVYVNFDAATLALDDVGERPWDRAFFRDISMALMDKGGARVLAFDFGFTPKSVSKMVPKENSYRSDSAMGELVSAYPNQVVLGCLYSGVPTPFVKASGASAFPPFFKDGYSIEGAELSGKYNYPESPTYPLQNYRDGNYLGRLGSFTVPPFRAVDNVPRWVPLWFPGGGKAHAYNLLGGKQSNLPFELSRDNQVELDELREQQVEVEAKKSIVLQKVTSLGLLINGYKEERETAMSVYDELSRELSVFKALEETIRNFKNTLKANPALSAVIQPQIDSRTAERNSLISKLLLSVDSNSSDSRDSESLEKSINELNETLTNLKSTLKANPAIASIIEPQVTLKEKELNILSKKLSSHKQDSEVVLSKDQEAKLFKELQKNVNIKKRVLDEINKNLAIKTKEMDVLRAELSESGNQESIIGMRLNQLEGKVETQLVERNNTLRLVYKGSENQDGSMRLVDSLPNQVPLFRDRNIYTLGVESLLAYYGLDSENVIIDKVKNRFKIIDRNNNLLVNAPLTEKQFLEVNWFSGWSEKLPEKTLVMRAKRAYGDENLPAYLALVPSILETLLKRVDGFEIPSNPNEYPAAMKDLGIDDQEILIAEKLLSSTLSDDEVPSFDELMKLIDAIAYYFIPPTLEFKYNPMCGMRDVLQNSQFKDQVEATIISIEEKIQTLAGANFLGKINNALEQSPNDENLIAQKLKIENAIIANKDVLISQQNELARIHDFFARFQDAIVLIGPEEKTFQDLAPTPFDADSVPKVGVHGNLIKTLTSGLFIKRLPIQVEHAATLGIGIIMALLAVYQGSRSSWVQAGGIILLLGYVYFGFITFSNTHVVWPITAPACAGISTSFIGLAAMVVIEQKAKGRLKGMFGSYVSSELVEQMVESGEEPSLGGQETGITAFFSDVQAFSSFSELLSPTGLVDLMNEYLTAMTNILQEERGTLDKYIGDAIVAMYGAPIPMDDHAYQSVRTAILMQKRQIELRDKWAMEEDKWGKCHGLVSKMQTRIGCNTGTATVGNMGALDRFNYTMMGDMVNLAARCESGAKAYGAYIMITEETKLASQKTRDDIAFRYLDKIVVKGRKEAVSMFEPTGFMSELSLETQDCLDCFRQGIDNYLLQDWDGALRMFEKSKGLEPNKPGITPGVVDNPSMILINRCQTMKENPPGEDWDGVYVMTSK